MTDILCKWLNEELQLSQAVEPKNFAKIFSSGYLIGEVLHKYQLQNDFGMFMKKDSSISRLSNFTRLEPTLQSLGISFDMNTAQELMQEKEGVATHLLYQLYVSLEKKKKTQRPHQMVKRDAELKLQKISQHYEEKCQQWNDRSVMSHPIQQRTQLKVQNVQRMKSIAAIVQVPKPPPYTSKLNLKRRQQQLQCRAQQAQRVKTEIAQFETNRKKLGTCGFASSLSGQLFPGDFPLGGSSQGSDVPGSGTRLILQSSSKYIQDIRQRLEENAVDREQREKRRDRFLVGQLKAHEAQEEARREEQLVKRLTRQTQQEKRLAAQLLQMRMQKEVIRQNRLFKEQQYQQRREKDFQEALEREAALAQQATLEHAEEIRQELEFCNRIAAERAQSKYKKHFASCKDILEQIVDLATKVGEYRLLTGNLIPEKLMREWKELLFSGLPLYEPIKGRHPGFEFSTPVDPVELKKQEILRNQDYDDYTNMVGEWAWPEESGETKLPLTNNNILGHVVVRLRNIAHPLIVEPSSPSFPRFTLKACVLGKFCSGKTTCLAKLAKAHDIIVLSADTLIAEALSAYQNGEEVGQIQYDSVPTEQQEDKYNKQLSTSSPSLKPDLDTQAESRDSNIRGAAAEKELRKGNAVPAELLVDIIVGAIRQVPSQSGWILDGFPVDITQAYLLEKALGGSADVGNAIVSSGTNLAADPNPPKPAPPPTPVLDLALLLDIPDECVVRRAFSQTDSTAARTSHLTDYSLYLAQTPHRITAFNDTWPKLEKWYGGKQDILICVDADVDEEKLYKRIESVLQQVMIQTQKAVATPPSNDVVLETGKAPDSSSSAMPPPADKPTGLKDNYPGPTQSHSSLYEGEAQSVNSHTNSNTHSSRGHSRRASTSSVINENSQGILSNPPESTSPCPGSASWIYVDEPLPPEIPEYLCSYWDTMCDSYVHDVKTVMQQQRSQRTFVIHHLYNIREEYKHYLGRPDLKQELVSQWQKDFNSIPDDMREDEDTKAELHLRLDELCERLWDISDKRKEEDEQEMAALMSEGWLEDHTTVLINHHSVLMQVELDRFRAMHSFLMVYYLSMCNQALPELPSNFVCIPLLDTVEIKDHDKSTEAAGTSYEDGQNKRKTKLHPDSKTKGQDQTKSVKPVHEKLICDYEEALTVISRLVSAEAHQGETKEQNETLLEKETGKTSASANKKEKGKQSSKKQKGLPSPPPAPSPAPAHDKNSERNYDQEAQNKIHKEYTAALTYEENAAKVRIALVKAHGLMMIQSLQSRAEQTLSSMQRWLEAHYVAEMKSIDQLSKVVRHHIEAGAKLLNELVLEYTDFYLNGDLHMVARPPPHPRPPTLEKPIGTTPTIAQLESLHQQFCTIAPSGLMSSSEFSSLLRDITSVNMSRNTLPEPWIEKSETQLMEIVSLLTDKNELIEWRRFLLSAALPWPFPSLTQLLVVLQRFKAADTGDTGFINEEQYLETELWFSNESVQPVSEDPSEPLPYDRLANLREVNYLQCLAALFQIKFFFQLFADHSVSPPRLDYVSMLQYFAADTNPRQGFIRALSVVLGRHLKHSLPGNLVKSMPSIDEATELSFSELDGEYKEDETPCVSSSLLGEQEVSIPALLAVICHRVTKMNEDNPLPPGCLSQKEHTEHLVHIFRELGYKPEDCVPFSVLLQHPFTRGLMEKSTQYQFVNIHRVLLAHQDEGETNSLTVP